MKKPQAIDEINTQWLTETLEQRYPGTVVEQATIGTVINGTASKIRLLLDYNDIGHNHGLPATMWFKGGLEVHSVMEHMLTIYATEANFLQRYCAAIVDETSKLLFCRC